MWRNVGFRLQRQYKMLGKAFSDNNMSKLWAYETYIDSGKVECDARTERPSTTITVENFLEIKEIVLNSVLSL